MNKRELAKALHDKKYNCAQAVACAFSKEVGADERVIFSACEGFGAGMGTGSTCGALSGAIFIAGLKNSDRNLDNPSTKQQTYALAREITEVFLSKVKSTSCSKIKEKPLCSCEECIYAGVDATEEVLKI